MVPWVTVQVQIQSTSVLYFVCVQIYRYRYDEGNRPSNILRSRSINPRSMGRPSDQAHLRPKKFISNCKFLVQFVFFLNLHFTLRLYIKLSSSSQHFLPPALCSGLNWPNFYVSQEAVQEEQEKFLSWTKQRSFSSKRYLKKKFSLQNITKFYLERN